MTPTEQPSFNSTQEMMDYLTNKYKLAPWYVKCWNWIVFEVFDPLRRTFSPFLISRRIRHLQQRLTRGWDDSDTWSLYTLIAKKFIWDFITVRNQNPTNMGYWSAWFFMNGVCNDDYPDFDAKKDNLYFKWYEEGRTFLKEHFIDTFEPKFVRNFVMYVYPRLLRFREIHAGVPMSVCSQVDPEDKNFDIAATEWNRIIDKMLLAFLTILEHTSVDALPYNKDIKEGMTLFFTYFDTIWW